MNKIISTIIICFLFSITTNAQYTRIINSNTPGHTDTPYAVGTNVYQFENTVTLGNFKQDKSKAEFITNNFNFRHGFWKEKLEASLVHKFTSLTNANISGTEMLSVGLKYLVFNYIQKRDYTYTRSWEKTHGFQYKNLIPSLAVKVQYNTPFTNSIISDGKSSISAAIIAQSQLTSKLRINNQLEYNSIMGNAPEFIYSLSVSRAYKNLFNPYAEFRFHNLKNNNYIDVGVGTPFLVNRDLSIAVQYNYNFGKNISGSVFGINASYRLNRHYDKWVTKRTKKEKGEEEEEDVKEKSGDITGGKAGDENKKLSIKKAQDAEYLDSILDPKKREKAKKKMLKADKKAEKKRLKAERKAKKRAKKEGNNGEINEESIDNESSEIDKKAEKKRLKAKRKAEKKRLKAERKAKKRAEKEGNNGELYEESIDNESSEIDKKAEKKRLKAERKAKKRAEKEEKKRLKKEAKQRKKDEKNKKEGSLTDDVLLNY